MNEKLWYNFVEPFRRFDTRSSLLYVDRQLIKVGLYILHLFSSTLVSGVELLARTDFSNLFFCQWNIQTAVFFHSWGLTTNLIFNEISAEKSRL